MTASQFRTALARIGLSQTDMSWLLNYNDRTVRRWALGERGVPPAVAILLRLMVAGKVTVADISALVE